MNNVDGILVVDKPAGWTSHDVVAKVRRLANTKKVGHLGTLDPMATGVLPLVLGRATRLAQFFVRNDKTYEGVIRFGYATDTYDREGTPAGEDARPEIVRAELETVLDHFRGPLQQVPPPVSAKKIGGVPAYKLARKNQPVDLKPVPVTVHELELLSLDGRDARVRVHCSAGAYLRSIAHDAGKLVGCGAFLQELRRMASGDFDLAQSRTIETLTELSAGDRLSEAIIPAVELLPDYPVERVDQVTVAQIRNGRDFRTSPFRPGIEQKYVKAVSDDGELIAIGEAVLPYVYHPILVF